jgi:glycosyltransferase involved in cell wall biosynthesis
MRARLPLRLDRIVSAAGAARTVWRTHRSFLAGPRGAIDQPQPGQLVPRAPFQLLGWCLFPDSTVARVDLYLDGRHLGPARLGMERPDITRLTRHPDGPICGFEYIVDGAALPADTREFTIGATARSLRGERLVLDEVALSLAPAEPPFEDADARAAQLRARGRPRIELMSPDGQLPGLRVLCFAHQLPYGGASLYLLDVLRRLAPDPDFSCTVVTLEDGPLRPDLEALGIPVHVTNGFPVVGVDEYEGHLAELTAWAAPQGFNLVFVNTMRAFVGGDLAARLEIPAVWVIHESFDLRAFWLTAYPPDSLHSYVRERAGQVLREAAAVLFDAEATRRLYLPYADADRLITLPYGVESAEIAAFSSRVDAVATRRRLGVPDEAPVLLCLGTIEPRKGQTMLAQAFNTVAPGHPEAQLVMVGETDAAWCAAYTAGLHHYLARAGLADRIRVLPVTPAHHPWLLAADALICASYVESLPRSILEAMAFEKPVLSTRVFGVPELIEDGRTGYLCEMRDVESLAHGLERVLGADPEERSAVARAGAARVRERHDPHAYVERVRRLLAGLAADPVATPRDLVSPAEAIPAEPPAGEETALQ